MIPHCLDDRLTDRGEAVRLTHRPRSSLQEHYFSASSTYLCQKLSNTQGLVQLEENNSLGDLPDGSLRNFPLSLQTNHGIVPRQSTGSTVP
jgi:hypothetical protein